MDAKDAEIAAAPVPEPPRRPELLPPAHEPIPRSLAILPVRDVVLFPGIVVPLSVSRASSLKLLEESIPQSKVLAIFTQRDAAKDDPAPADLYPIGCAVNVLKLIRQPDETVVVLVQAFQRIGLGTVLQTEPYLRAEVQPLASTKPPADPQWEAEVKNLRESAIELLQLTPEVPEQLRHVLANLTDGEQLTDFLAPNLQLDLVQKQALLAELDVAARLRAVQTHLGAQLEIAHIQQKLQKDVAARFNDAQRQAYLREQLKAIRKELGEEGGGSGEEQVEQLRVRLEAARLPTEVMAQAERELKRLSFVPEQSPEHSVIVTYLETLADLPWQKVSEDQLDLDEAQRILDRDHFGLTKVKRRLIEYLAVRKLNPRGRGPILCLLGPPGVGKTSLGQSIADALGRKFARLSLGGMRDEAEIRGHRRTYIGSMPGRIIQELRRVGTRNPVLMLDELDKMGADFRGDPASAMLEVLDPRQNNAFVDRYLDVPFDLSDIIFIATTNVMDTVPAPLRDRMEVISIPGYTEREKLEIAKRYIVPRQLTENGLKAEQCVWEEGALQHVVSEYTHEAGVRNLERQIGAVCRAIAARVARGEVTSVAADIALVDELLGPPRHMHEERLRTPIPGVVTGLAYTPMGGEILHIEAVRYAGRGEIKLTGQIGEVMRESAQAALSLVRHRAEKLGIDPAAFRESDVHVHIPAGAIPKDGPSAGAAMFTALASLFTNKPVRTDIAMTGEINLRGMVTPIGGLKEKSLAAVRAGISRVIIPKLNATDLADVPEEAKEKIEFRPVETVDEVLALALESPAPIEQISMA